MKVLIVGGGGREHALAWALSRSPKVKAIFTAPGNGGTAQLGTNIDLSVTDIDGLLEFANEQNIDLTVVGPEAPLMAGIVNRFEAAGRICYGPRSDAAILEGSKAFAKDFMERHNIPTAGFKVFNDPEKAKAHVIAGKKSIVIKADGLAAGKGVYVVHSHADATAAIDDIMLERKFGAAGSSIVIEEFLEGDEISIHAICADGRALVLPSSQDHKRVRDGDEGPNTGGMGAYAPVPSFTAEEMKSAHAMVIEPTLRGLADEGIEFSGTLYVGLIRTRDGVRVLEYNVRFGDPETEVLLPLIKSDLFDVLDGAARGQLPETLDVWEGRTAATVVMASDGYPGDYQKGFAITGLDNAVGESVVPFHAGTTQTDAAIVTSGGRVLAVTAWNDNIRGALNRAYDGVASIDFDGAFWRKDIGQRAL